MKRSWWYGEKVERHSKQQEKCIQTPKVGRDIEHLKRRKKW